ncbi:MAG TPA: hypothetical protein VIF84_10990 [Candidatus Limnocylindrales bacterium]|jgi:hypothetical protein
MTTERIDRLPELLEELAAPRTPAYYTDILARTSGQRQRSARTLMERILPMSETTLPSVRSTPPAWRTFAIVLLLAALVIALAATAFIASRPPLPLPAPYGVAANGLVAYSAGGDIHAADPVTGIARVIVTGPEMDRSPIFSRDGAQMAFRRQRGDVLGRTDDFDLVVARADGTGARVLTSEPISIQDPVEWSPDGSFLLLLNAHEQIVRIDASGATPPVVIADGVGAGGTGPVVTFASLRPPNGAQILFRPRDGSALSIMDADGTGARTLIEKPGSDTFEPFRWSPDGTMIAFRQSNDDDGTRTFIMNADGSGVRQLSDEPGVWVESDFAWSPDGKSIAINRWRMSGSGMHEIQPIGVVSIDGGPVVGVGPVPVSEGAVFDWSPDGSTILSLPATVYEGVPNAGSARPIAIDPVDGTWRELAVDVESAASWQRTAP